MNKILIGVVIAFLLYGCASSSKQASSNELGNSTNDLTKESLLVFQDYDEAQEASTILEITDEEGLTSQTLRKLFSEDIPMLNDSVKSLNKMKDDLIIGIQNCENEKEKLSGELSNLDDRFSKLLRDSINSKNSIENLANKILERDVLIDSLEKKSFASDTEVKIYRTNIVSDIDKNIQVGDLVVGRLQLDQNQEIYLNNSDFFNVLFKPFFSDVISERNNRIWYLKLEISGTNIIEPRIDTTKIIQQIYPSTSNELLWDWEFLTNRSFNNSESKELTFTINGTLMYKESGSNILNKPVNPQINELINLKILHPKTLSEKAIDFLKEGLTLVSLIFSTISLIMGFFLGTTTLKKDKEPKKINSIRKKRKT